jgi:hypothetical protein
MFADVPLDNRTVDQIAAFAACWPFIRAVENVTAARNDLKFRGD